MIVANKNNTKHLDITVNISQNNGLLMHNNKETFWYFIS
jgi:hypothetical protein